MFIDVVLNSLLCLFHNEYYKYFIFSFKVEDRVVNYH